MVRKQNIWIGVRPLHPERVSEIRSALSPVLPPTFSPDADPHITVLQCNFPESELHRLETRARRLGLIGQEFHVEGFRCHPTATDPEYIMLDVDFDLSAARTELAEFVRSHGCDVLGNSAPAHITLWKNQHYASIDDDESLALAEQMADLLDTATWSGKIGDVAISTF